MKKLIKADLSAVLRLIPTYQPVSAARIEQSVAELCRCEHTDYLFLNRREKSHLFPPPAVYEPDSYENLTWLYGTASPNTPVLALFLHITRTENSRPVGTVTMLDYPATARDVEVFSALTKAERERHVQLITKRMTRQTRYCSILELIQYLKTGR